MSEDELNAAMRNLRTDESRKQKGKTKQHGNKHGKTLDESAVENEQSGWLFDPQTGTIML